MSIDQQILYVFASPGPVIFGRLCLVDVRYGISKWTKGFFFNTSHSSFTIATINRICFRWMSRAWGNIVDRWSDSHVEAMCRNTFSQLRLLNARFAFGIWSKGCTALHSVSFYNCISALIANEYREFAILFSIHGFIIWKLGRLCPLNARFAIGRWSELQSLVHFLSSSVNQI